MKKFSLCFCIAIFTGMVLSCKKDNPQSSDPPTPAKEMSDLVISPDFSFKNTKIIPVDVMLPFTVDYSQINGKVEFYYRYNGLNQVVKSGLSDHSGHYAGNIEVPAWIDTLFVQNTAGEVAIPLKTQAKGTLDNIYVNFGNTLDTLPPAMPVEDLKNSGRYTPENVFTGHSGFTQTATSNSLIANGDFAANVFGSISHWDSNFPDDDKWYITSELSGKAIQYTDAGNKCLRIASPGARYGGVAQMINATAGQLITLSGNIKVSGSGTKYAWLYLIPKNAAGEPIAYYAVEEDSPSTSWGFYSVMATMPAGTVSCEVLLWMNSWGGYIYFDNIVATGPNPDSDGDGVIDAEDDYPNDAARALDLFYPADGTFGTFAFEDNWPHQADYDFNDLVVEFQFKQVLNAGNALVDLYGKFSVRAIGASFKNGFGFQMDMPPSNVSNITGNSITGDYLNFSANKTESGQSKAVIIVTDNPFVQLPHPGSGAGVNTTPGSPYVIPDTLSLHVSLVSPVPVSAVGLAPYNPFIIVNRERGREIHLNNQAPTDLADPAFFGTGADNSIPASGRYYKTINNLTWGLEVPVGFNYMVEKTRIIDGYLKFESWAESSGNTYSDWHISNAAGYRNTEKIY